MATAIREFLEETGSDLTIANPQPYRGDRGGNRIIVGWYTDPARGDDVITSWGNLGTRTELFALEWRAVDDRTNFVGSAFEQRIVDNALRQVQPPPPPAPAPAQGQGGNVVYTGPARSYVDAEAFIKDKIKLQPGVKKWEFMLDGLRRRPANFGNIIIGGKRKRRSTRRRRALRKTRKAYI
jgi:hypothetical protein